MKYHVSQDREFQGKIKVLSRRDARKLVVKVTQTPDHVFDMLDNGELQLYNLGGWGWIKTEPRRNVRGMPKLRKKWWNDGIDHALDALHSKQLSAQRAGAEEQATVLGELASKLKELRKGARNG